MENVKSAHINQNSKQNKTVKILIIAAIIVGILAGTVLLYRRQILQKEAIECPNGSNRKTTCQFDYQTWSSVGYSVWLEDPENPGIKIAGPTPGTLPDTQGEWSSLQGEFQTRIHDFENIDPRDNFKCIVEGNAGSPECPVPVRAETTQQCFGPTATPTPSPTPDDMSPICVVDCSCEDIGKTMEVTVYPTYAGGQPGIQEGRYMFTPSDCFNCTKLIYREKNTGIVITAYPTKILNEGDEYGICLNEDLKPVEEFGLEYRCHQADANNGSPICRTYEYVMTHLKPTTTDCPPETTVTPEFYECKYECEACCPVCSNPQPMMVGYRTYDKTADEWTVQPNIKECPDWCTFEFLVPAEVDNYIPQGGYIKGNDGDLTKVPPRGEAIPDAPRQCIQYGHNVVIKVGDDVAPNEINNTGDIFYWDEFDFDAQQPKPSTIVEREDQDDITHRYDDPGVYDIRLQCKFRNNDFAGGECIKRIAVVCDDDGGGDEGGGGGGGTIIPPTDTPPPTGPMCPETRNVRGICIP